MVIRCVLDSSQSWQEMIPDAGRIHMRAASDTFDKSAQFKLQPSELAQIVQCQKVDHNLKQIGN